MAFLTINGIDIPVAFGGGRRTPVRIGGASRSLNGTYIDSIRTIKRQWKFKTPPISQAEVDAITGILHGLGQHWAFDSDAVADSGLTPSSGDTGAVYHGANAADGDPQKLVHTAPATTSNLYALDNAIWCAKATSNILQVDSSNADETGGATNGYAQVNTPAPFATNTSHYWQGTRSIEVTDDGGADCGIETDDDNASAGGTVAVGNDVTASVWVKGAAGSSVTISIRWRTVGDAETGTPASTTFTIAANEWRRIWVTGTAPANTDHIRVRVVHGTATATFYVDGFQAAKLDTLTPWVVGQGSYSNIIPTYGNPFPAGTKSCTVALWTAGSAEVAHGSGNGAVWNVYIDGSNYLLLQLVNSTETIRLQTRVAGTTVTSSGAATPFGTLAHIVGVYTPTTQKLYKNGALEDSDSVAALAAFDFDSLTNFYAGGWAGGLYMDGFVDQLLVLPYELTADQISDLYNSGTPQAVGSPRLICTGDFAQDASVICRGAVQSAAYRGLTLDGVWNNNAQTLEFVLHEV